MDEEEAVEEVVLTEVITDGSFNLNEQVAASHSSESGSNESGGCSSSGPDDSSSDRDDGSEVGDMVVDEGASCEESAAKEDEDDNGLADQNGSGENSQSKDLDLKLEEDDDEDGLLLRGKPDRTGSMSSSSYDLSLNNTADVINSQSQSENEDKVFSFQGPVEVEDKIAAQAREFWSLFTGLKVKQFTESEMDAFRKPFEIGWKREVVLRGTVTNSGKKIGDVYYFSPDKKVKLRSYVEMGLYLKRHQNCGLEPENFTFARQPIYKAPEEVVRHAMSRGSGGTMQHIIVNTEIPIATVKSPVPTENYPLKGVASTSDSGAEESFNSATSVAEGRAKRKRVAPSRFEDEDYSEQSPFKKKTKPDKPANPSVQTKTLQPKSPLVTNPVSKSVVASQPNVTKKSQPGQTLLQTITTPSQQIHHVVVSGLQPQQSQHQHLMIQKPFQQQPKAQSPQASNQNLSSNNGPTKTDEVVSNGCTATSETYSAGSSPTHHPVQTSARKSASFGLTNKPALLKTKMGFKPIKPKPVAIEQENNSNIEPPDIKPRMETGPAAGQPIAPCSIMCIGRNGSLPSLLCSRCLCLFHPECVPTGIYLKDPHKFVCPNCIQPSDCDRQIVTAQSAASSDCGESDQKPLSDIRLPRNIHGRSTAAPTSLSSSPRSTPINSMSSMLSNKMSNYPLILPKPAYNQRQQMFRPNAPQRRIQQQQPYSGQPLKLPAGTHLYRVPGPNNHRKNQRNYHGTPQNHFPFSHNSKKIQQKRAAIEKLLNAEDGGHPYNPMPIAPIGPIKMSSYQVASMLNYRDKRGYRDYLLRYKSHFTSFVSGYECLNLVLSKLGAAELVKMKRVNRTLNSLASQPFLWDKIYLKNVHINDWQFLGRNIVETYGSTELDFDGLRCPVGIETCDVWRNFSSIIDYLKTVKHLRFGTIPSFVIEEVLQAAVTENCYNSFEFLETLCVKSLFEEDSPTNMCHLKFIEQLNFLPNLKTLHLQCKHGFISDPGIESILSTAFSSLPKLRQLILPSLKGYSSEQFAFLSHLKDLQRLEIGSCESWTPATDGSEVEPSIKQEEDQQQEAVLKGAFKYLSELTNLRYLRLIDVIIDETSNHLAMALQKLKHLETIDFDTLTISPDATESNGPIDLLIETMQSQLENLKIFIVSTDDPHTNKSTFDLLKKLENLKKVVWKVGAVVEDSGECFVPFTKERIEDMEMEGDMDLTGGDANIEMMDMTILSELLQNHLVTTIIDIIPQ